jgi:hypothetical protein
MHSLTLLVRCAAIAATSIAAIGSAQPANACDRTCLRTTAQRYLAALVEHAPAKAGLADTIRYTENAVDVKPGNGLWQSATALGKVIRIYVDAEQGQAGVFGLIEEQGVPAIVSLRLKVSGGKISEAEAIIGRKGVSLYDPETMAANAPSDRSIDASLRSSRKDMIAAAASYFDGAQSQNPKIVLQRPGCDRFENGVKMTNRAGTGAGGVSVNRDCAGTLENAKQIAAVVNRRYPVVDEDVGVVMATAVFNRPPGAKRNDGTLWPKLLLTEFFPVERARFTSVHAAMFYLPPEITDSGWRE